MTASYPSLAAIAAAATIPMAVRLGHEIPKQRNWQDFQRYCVVLFRDELQDPHAQEYGREGQDQHGIDILAKRRNDPEDQVAVQCRRYKEPLTYAAMLKDARRAIAHFGKLRELIFATTFEDSSKVTDHANDVEKLLRSEGHQIRVIVYGWESLQQIIIRHDAAYALFCPWILSTSAPQSLNQQALSQTNSMQEALAETLRQMMRPELLNAMPPDQSSATDRASEDPALHARIDVFRDMFTKDWLVVQAERGLRELEKSPGLETKPWAKFRIETNLASLAFATGREAEAIFRYEEAHKLLPDDAAANANLSLARTMQGQFREAMQLAQRALLSIPKSEHAISYLLQAAARCDWDGNPETLIPADLVGGVQADLGLAEFYRRREVPGWQQQSIEIANRHPDVPEFGPVHAIAVLSLALESGQAIAGGLGPVSSADLTAAANESKAWIQRMLDFGVGGEHDQRAHLNNACVLLRLCARHAEAEQLLQRASTLIELDPLLRRLLAVTQLSLGKRTDAIKNLEGDADPENVLFHAELIASDNLDAALAQALTVDTGGLPDRLKSIRAQMIADLSLRLHYETEFKEAVADLRAIEPEEPFADLIELRAEKQNGLTEEKYREALLDLAHSVSSRASIMGRTMLATELQDADCPAEASYLLDERVDLSRVTPTSIFYLHTLASARRDEPFQKALDEASEALRTHPDILWFRSAHAWNTGDLDRALETVNLLISHQPDLGRARLHKLEVLLRQNNTPELLKELEQPLEQLSQLVFLEKLRLASLLRSFGFLKRAAYAAYQLFLENRENPRAWLAMMNIVVADRQNSREESPWNVVIVGPDVAVDLTFDDGQTRFFIVEGEKQFRNLDGDSWEPNHALVKAVTGLANGARFADDEGREGTITNLRHKIVARFHYVLEHYEARFPGRNDLRRISVDPGQPGGLDEFKAQLKDHSDWVRQEQEQWINGVWPLSWLAMRLHIDIIDVAIGLAAQGIKLKVAEGTEPEKKAALNAVRSNQQKGCVLDLHAFWTAWQLQHLEIIEAVGGRVHVCQGVIDRLRARQEKLQVSAHDGQKIAHFDKGQMFLSEASPDAIQEWVRDLDQAIAWLQVNAVVCPVIISEGMPTLLRDHVTSGNSDIYDALALAMQKELLLVTDDLPTRIHAWAFGFHRACWTQIILKTALQRREIKLSCYVRAVGHLIEAGHDYLGVSGPELVSAWRLDLQEGKAVTSGLFSCLSETIGGRNAEPISHATAVVAFLMLVTNDTETKVNWKPAASNLLRNLLRRRHEDYLEVFKAVAVGMKGDYEVIRFLLYWAKGHFLPL